MIKRGIIAILVLLALGGLCSSALGQGSANESISSNETLKAPENVLNKNSAIGLPEFNLVEFAQPSPAMIEVPINILNNTTKEVWTSPDDKPIFVFAGLTNNGKLDLDVYTISLDAETRERTQPQLAGTALSGGDGVIIYGKFIAIEVKCQNSTTKQYCTGTLETANWFPK
jgi:hypothetical protein